MYQQNKDLPKCKKCGETVPEGKDLCWCCEHTPKLHKPEKWAKCGEDKCNIGGLNDGRSV